MNLVRGPYLTLRPLKNAPFCPIPASGSNFNPQNTTCIPVVKIFAFLGLEQNGTFFKGLTFLKRNDGFIIILSQPKLKEIFAKRHFLPDFGVKLKFQSSKYSIYSCG